MPTFGYGQTVLITVVFRLPNRIRPSSPCLAPSSCRQAHEAASIDIQRRDDNKGKLLASRINKSGIKPDEFDNMQDDISEHPSIREGDVTNERGRQVSSSPLRREGY